MAGVMIKVGPHKASHTAVAISWSEEPLGELRLLSLIVLGTPTRWEEAR